MTENLAVSEIGVELFACPCVIIVNSLGGGIGDGDIAISSVEQSDVFICGVDELNFTCETARLSEVDNFDR